MALGSSDAAIVAGVSRYGSPLELFYKLRGDLPRYDNLETMQQRIGVKLEPVIAELVAEELNLKIRRLPVRVHPSHKFMVAHADFEIVNNAKGPGLMEVKNRSGEKPWETVPDDVLIQVVHQLAVANRDHAIVGALFQFGQVKGYEVERDTELEEYLIELEARFMLRVTNGEPPDHTWTPETVGILKKLYPTDSGQTIALPEAVTSSIAGFLEAKEVLDVAEQRKASNEGILKSAMGAATYATCPGYNLSWKSTKPSQKFDLDTFEKEQPELYRHYLKTVPGHRRFTIKPSKELRT